MANVHINCNLRNEIGSKACHRIRSRGQVPGVIYGHHFSGYSVQFDALELNKVIKEYGENALINVEVEGNTFPVMIKEIQRDPIKGNIIHIDLQKIYETEKIHVTVPIVLKGKEYVKNIGVIQQQLKNIEIECLPTQVPKNITVDISNLLTGRSLRVSDVEFGEEISVLNDKNEVIVSLASMKNEDGEEVENEDEVDLI
ncbi:50S ribosomal protein L25 [Caloranaerobacter ferrireducens]|uniref:50S ribosomal protein L25 n=1 Tax=Caloranaerobacter ferrireducens TaxID=1323370 RepID=UPI00084D4D32|nr:50S ribosomal protein L25 [Caloranaerobacter ferrireducens]